MKTRGSLHLSAGSLVLLLSVSHAASAVSAPGVPGIHAASEAAPPPPCASSPDYRSLDFTIGHWTVVDSDGHPIGTSSIQSDLNGCVVIENWVAPDGAARGRNVDAYNAEDQRWHRFFVDNRGHVHDFEGVSAGNSVRYEGLSTGPNGEQVRHRLTIRKEGPDRVTQLWEKSNDAGKTWQTAFQGVFSRAQH
jgi:hypothetical protein